MARLARLGAGACAAGLAVLTLVPGGEIDPVRSGYYSAGLIQEHALAYALTTLLALAGYAGRWGVLGIGLALASYGAVLEMLQAFSPGRHAQASDAVENAVGVAVATVVWVVARRAMRRPAA
jgi:VanZ family protein